MDKWVGGGKAGKGWRVLGRAILYTLVGLLLLAGCLGLGFPAEAAGPQTRDAHLEFYRDGRSVYLNGAGEAYPWSYVESVGSTEVITGTRTLRYENTDGELRWITAPEAVEIHLVYEERVCRRFLFWRKCWWEERAKVLLSAIPGEPQVDIPPRPADSRPSSGRTHTVQSGETLCGIAQQYGLRWDDLARINGLEHPYIIHPGDTIKLY